MRSLSFLRIKIFPLASCLALAVPAAASAQPAANASSDGSSAYAQAVTAFPVFAQPSSADDALPSHSAYTGGISRRIAGSTQPFPAWGVLRGTQVCVTVDARSGPAAGGPAACNSIGRLTRPGQILVLGASTGNGTAPQILAGLVPGGVSSVTVFYQNGSLATVPVKKNGFTIATGGRMPRSLRWVNGSMSLAAANLPTAPNYNGEFCYGVALQEFGSCVSNTVPNIRRAIGHGTYYTFVSIAGGSLAKTGRCYSDGCTADTGYLSQDVTGGARIENSGPCSPCWGTYYGWLYP